MTTRGAPKIAIIGAGMTGLTCARLLHASGLAPIVFDKSSGIGGRLATRRWQADLSFDHGAQYFTTRSQAFRSCVESCRELGTVAPWTPTTPSRPVSENWYVGTPTMNAFLKLGAADLDVRLNTAVAGLRREGPRWRLVEDAFGNGPLFDVVAVTAPAPQTLALVTGSAQLSEQVSRAEMAPCWAVMLALDEPSRAGLDGFKAPHPAISWLGRNSSKPNRSRIPETWVAHACPKWSQMNAELSQEKVCGMLLPIALQILGEPALSIRHAAAHRWRYAQVTKPAGALSLVDESGSLHAAGDWCLGPRVECAFESGSAAATKIIEFVSDWSRRSSKD